MNNNLEIYEAGRSVPVEAQKKFNNGKFSGTDINPMWRIKKLTKIFGPAGIGWYYEILSERAEQHGEDVMAIVDLNLYVKYEGEWSKPIYGTGGNILLHNGKMSDEGYKMALTDDLSIACKALGIGADIWYAKDVTKYTKQEEPEDDFEELYMSLQNESSEPQCSCCGEFISDKVARYSIQKFKRPLCYKCQQKEK